MKKLTALDISGIRTPNLSVLRNFSELVELDFNGNILVKDLSPIEGLIQLVFLNMSGCLMVDDLYYIRKLTSLVFFFCGGCPRIKSGWPIRGIKSLFMLDISSTSIPYSEIAEFKRLAKLSIFAANSRDPFYARAVSSSKTRKKINSFRTKLNF